MIFDLDEARANYEHRGYAVMRLLSDGHAHELSKKANQLMDAFGVRRRIETKRNDRVGDMGGPYRYELLTGLQIGAHFHELTALYNGWQPFVSGLTQGDVHLSPYENSTVNVQRYREPDDQSAWHYDTNGISLVVFLESAISGGGVFEIYGRDEDLTLEPHPVLIERGMAVLFQGTPSKGCLHRGAPLGRGQTKMLVCFNYYYAGDYWRPQEADLWSYGEWSGEDVH